jgi:hypothetical protein
MESVFYGLNNENMKIEYDKDFENVMNELQTNFGWRNIEILPDSYKDLLNDTIKAVKNCSIPAVVGRSEQLVCVHPYEEVYQSETECYCEKCGKDITEAN